jgi:hypothetical protein
VQMPGGSVLSGKVYVALDSPMFTGTLSTVDGSQTLSLNYFDQFELPLGTKSGEWYLSSVETLDCQAQLEPVAPNLLKVLNLTRITPTTPEQYVPYGQEITVGGVLEGWTQATGWQPVPSRSITVLSRWYDPSPVTVTTDDTGGYTAQVEAFDVAAAGSAHFAGDDTWLRADGGAFVTHARLSVEVSDTTPGVGRRIRITGAVAPVRLEELRGDNWTVVAGPVTAEADGRYALRYGSTVTGTHQMRVWTDGTNPSGSLEGVYPYFQEFTLTSTDKRSRAADSRSQSAALGRVGQR